MLFNSVEYLLLFLPFVFTIYFILNKFKLYVPAKIFLLAASLFFYGTYKIDYVYILITSILVNYSLCHLFKFNLTQIQKRILLILILITNIVILVGFKYFVFLAKIYITITHTSFNTLDYIMPLGISFFTIQQISFVIDCYRGTIKDYKFHDYALFVSFFPQLIAGPIVRHSEIIPQFNNLSKRVINQQNIFMGIFLITVGLLKKVVLADNFVQFIDTVMRYQAYKDFYIAWLLGISKVMQGYFDFSGYCDMALGSAYLFNICLPLNFNSPYKAQSILEYWNRWNITLVRFLKDYIYYPLMNKSNSLLNSISSIMIVFLIYGLWKGSNPVNVVYGILNGILVCINKIWNCFNIKIPKILSVFLTFITLVLLSNFIGINSFEKTLSVLKSMLGIKASFNLPVIENLNIIFTSFPFELKFNLLLITACFILVFVSKNSNELAYIYSKKNNLLYTIILAVVFFISTLFITKSNEFIYFIF